MKLQDSVYIKDENLVAPDIGGEILIVPIRNRVGDLSSIYTLNEVAARVWQLLDAKTALNEIISAITREYEVSPEEATSDIAELIQVWEDAGLVRAVA